MAGTSDIIAGRAAVEIYLNRSALTKGLKSVAGEFKAFGDGAAAIGKRLMAMGAMITAPMMLAAKSWAESGAELARMSQRTGMAVEQLSALKFAAESTGTSFEAVESGIKRMQRAIYQAAQGNGSGPAFLHNLIGKDSETQLETIADKLATLTDPAQRAAVAMQIFGRGGTEMLPMLSKVSAGLREFRKEAENMGMIRSKESAEAGLALSVAFTHMTGALNSLKNALATAIGPLITGFLGGMKNNILAARDWLKSHQPLVQLIFKIGVAATAAGAGLYVFGKVMREVGNIFSVGVKIIGIVGHVISLLLLPVKMVSGLIGSVLSGALGIVKGAFSTVASVISGVFSAAIWGVKIAVGALAIAWSILTGALNIGISVISGVVGALAGFLAMGPVGILLLIPAALGLVAAWMAMKPAISDAASGLSEFGGKATQASKNAVSSAGKIVSDVGGKIREAVPQWVTAIKSFASNTASVVSQVFNSLKTDAIAGFHNLVNDVGSSWDTLQSLLQYGDFAEAWTLGLSIMKLEWARFSAWLGEKWANLTPSINVATEKVANVIGDTLTTLKVSWGDLWDALQTGLKTFLTALDTAFDTIKVYIGSIQGFIGNDPEAAKVKATELREHAARIREGKEHWSEEIQGGGGFSITPAGDERRARKLEADAREQDAIAKRGAWLNHSGPGMASMVGGPQSAEQKAKDDEAARKAGIGMKGAIGGAVKIGVETPAQTAARKAAADKEIADAQREKNDAQRHAAQAAAVAAQKQKEEKDKLLAGAGGKGAIDYSMMSGDKTRVAFGSVAASGLGGQGSLRHLQDISHKMDRFIQISANTDGHLRNIRLQAAI
jgi:hypothetical protein